MKSTPAKHLVNGQYVRIEGPGTVTNVEFDFYGETVDVTWRPDGEETEVTTTLLDEHPVKHAW